MRSPLFFECVNRVRDGLFGSETAEGTARAEPVEAY
jgi:hypothetical protein